GILPHDYRFELIDGELVPMSPKSAPHTMVQSAVMRAWPSVDAATVMILTEPTVWIGEHMFLEPDLYVCAPVSASQKIEIGGAKLVVEVAYTSVSADLGRKMHAYAEAGTPEYWVIDIAARVTHVHREPTETGFNAIAQVGWSDRLVPTRVPELAIRLDDLGLNLG
ncbi:MAG: Uma2 family endonuclease, partial [Pseudomonadota bacterium]